MLKTARSFLAGLAASAAFIAAPALARNVTADAAQIAALLKAKGRSAELKTTDGETYVLVSNGYDYTIFTFGCDGKGKNCKSVQFYAGFDPKIAPNLQTMNDYARDNRWGRIYLDTESDPAIEFDLDLEQGGMSEALFIDNVAYWETVLNRYGEFVFGPNGENNKAAK